MFEIKSHYTLADVPLLIRRLRDPERGCPWDIKQTHASIRQDLLEESYEVAQAIDDNDFDALEEELGDVLMQVVMHSEIEAETGRFTLDDVADRLIKKMVLRHPHVFGDVHVDSSDEVLVNWEAIKRKEKEQKTAMDAILAVPNALPALTRSAKVQKRAGYVGFDYPAVDDAIQDLESELSELEQARKGNGDIEEEVGDLLFAAVNVARLLKVDGELALTKTTEKFIRRFQWMEHLTAERGEDMSSLDLEALNGIWEESKKYFKEIENND